LNCVFIFIFLIYVMLFGDGAFGKSLRLDEVMKVESPGWD